MSHNIYTTSCIVLKNTPVREADVFVHALTPDFGLIRASGKGVRLPKSKLRGSLEDFSVGELSLVHGKEGWRITDARTTLSLYYFWQGDFRLVLFAARIFSLIRKLCPEEEKNSELFLTAHSAFEFIGRNFPSSYAIEDMETVLVLRILRNLGYLPKTEIFEDFVASSEWTIKILEDAKTHRIRAILEINRALSESQLVI